MWNKVSNNFRKVLSKILTFTGSADKDIVVTAVVSHDDTNTLHDCPGDSTGTASLNIADNKMFFHDNSGENHIIPNLLQVKVIVKDQSNVEDCVEKFVEQDKIFSEISRSKLHEFADNVELSEFFSQFNDERIKEIISELNTYTNTKAQPKDQNYAYSEEESGEGEYYYSKEQKVNIQEVDVSILRNMFKQYAFHNVIQGLNNQEKFRELEKHLDDATLYIPNYINKGYQTDINGQDISGDNSLPQIED
jgi:hypothetical protein